MKKVLVFLLAISSMLLQAQPFSFGAHFNLATPLGPQPFGSTNLANYTGKEFGAPGIGLGGGVEFNCFITDRFSAGVGVDFTSFSFGPSSTGGQGLVYDNYYSFESTASTIPLTINIKYLLTKKAIKPYIGFATGFAFYNQTKTVTSVSGDFITDPYWRETSKLSWKQNGFFVQPRFGLFYKISEEVAIDFSLQYTAMFNNLEQDYNITTTTKNGNTQTINMLAWQAEPTNYVEIRLGIILYLSK